MKNTAKTFRWARVLLFSAMLALALPVAHADAPPPIPADLFGFAHPVGQQRLIESDYKQAYWSLAMYFETQKNQAFCAVATAVIALNAAGVARPKTDLYPDYPYFTQQDFFVDISPDIADPALVSKEGMTLDQLGEVLNNFPVKAATRHADTLTLEEFRSMLKDNLRFSERFILLNFNRKVLNEAGGGHWSPIAAYHSGSDSALILDVARYKYPPLWVPVKDLYQAALSVDTTSGKARGFILLGKP